jgi:hypothetical protein
MPESEDDTRCQLVLPIGVRGNRLIHQHEDPFWLVVHFYINVELDVLILGLPVKHVGAGRLGVALYAVLTFIRRATVSANVGMACSGFLAVRTCSIPLGPYQSLSRICPVNGNFERQETHSFFCSTAIGLYLSNLSSVLDLRDVPDQGVRKCGVVSTHWDHGT